MTSDSVQSFLAECRVREEQRIQIAFASEYPMVETLLSQALIMYHKEEFEECSHKVVEAVFACPCCSTFVALMPVYLPMLTALQQIYMDPVTIHQHILKCGLSWVHDTILYGDSDQYWVLRGRSEAFESTVYLIRVIRCEGEGYHFPHTRTLTISRLYQIAGIYLARLSNTRLAFKCVKKAESLLHEGEPPEVLEFDYVNWQANLGPCVICCSALDLTGEKVQDCSGCLILGYCSPECQKEHWNAQPYSNSHKMKCEDLKKALAKLELTTHHRL